LITNSVPAEALIDASNVASLLVLELYCVHDWPCWMNAGS